MGKTLCKRKKAIKAADEINFICGRCGRVAPKKKQLCKAKKIASIGIRRVA